MIRSFFVTVAAVAIIGQMAGHHSFGGHHNHTRTVATHHEPRRVSTPARGRHHGGVTHAGLRIRLSPARLRVAARRCAVWATEAGFANNGYLGGSLTTAVAVALAESGCNPAACFDDTTGRSCSQASAQGSGDPVERGAWQLSSRALPSVSSGCAYSGLCNAKAAYRLVSAYGTYFGPWAVYLSDHFTSYLWAAQRAVSSLRAGTLTSALIGSCAAYPSDSPGARVRLANCGTAAADQIWTTSAGTLRTSGGLCLAAGSGRPGAVTVQSCTGGRRQDWQRRGGSALYNVGARRCLTDPGASLRPGHPLAVGSCGLRQRKAWFRP